MQWIDALVGLGLVGLISLAIRTFRNPSSGGGCHGSCGSCAQNCSYRSNLSIQSKKN